MTAAFTQSHGQIYWGAAQIARASVDPLLAIFQRNLDRAIASGDKAGQQQAADAAFDLIVARMAARRYDRQRLLRELQETGHVAA